MKAAIVVSLGELEELMKQFCAEQGEDKTLKELVFSEFLLWIKQRQNLESYEVDVQAPMV